MLTRFISKFTIPLAFSFATRGKKILIADDFSSDTVKNLKEKGNEVLYDKKLKEKALADAIAKFKPEVLVVRSTKIQKEHIDKAKDIKVIIRAGSGVDNIDIPYATKRKITVANCPGKNAVAVAELVMGLIMAVDRRIPENVSEMKVGKWEKEKYSQSIGIKGRTLGIIGHELAQRALCFDMNVLVHDVAEPKKLDKKVKFAKKLEELVKKADIISLHVPKTPKTSKMVNKKFLGMMKKEGVLINTSRSDVVVEKDIIEHLNKNKNFWYAADVWEKEPSAKKAKYSNKLALHPRCYGSHHIGASTKQAEKAIGDEAYRMILEYVKTNKVPNSVNLKKLKA